MVGLVVALGCSDPPAPPPVGTDAGAPDPCTATGVECVGDVAHTCDGDRTAATADCAALGQTCVPGLGCQVCAAGTVRCEGETVMVCNAEGSGFETGETCSGGQRCSPAGCADLCAEAEASSSYIGCEYWPATVMNSQVAPEMDFAVVVANPQLVPAEVRVERAGGEVAQVVIAPGDLAAIPLPWVDALKGTFGSERTEIVRDGAYRLQSDVPVTVYQFDPLPYRIERDCLNEPAGTMDGQCYSFSNDASLLLPTHVLTGNALAVSWPSMLLEVPNGTFRAEIGSPGFVAIIGTEDGTTVELRAAAFVTSSADGAVAALTPGDTASVSLDRGDVLQLVAATPTMDECPERTSERTAADEIVTYCDTGPDYDLTGTEIRASAPVSVIGGHNCTFVPFDRWACDHLEQATFPAESWGRDFLVGATQPLRGEPNVIRVIAANEGTRVRFEPPLFEEQTLGRGEWFRTELDSAVRVIADGPIAVQQLLVGQDYAGIGTSGRGGNGDPSMSLAIPTEQLRTEYTFLAPDTYIRAFVNVTAPLAARVFLDGRLLRDFEPIGDTGSGVLRVPIESGVHRMSGTAPFGVVVYGFGQYTSYMFPGGLDLRAIAPPI